MKGSSRKKSLRVSLLAETLVFIMITAVSVGFVCFSIYVWNMVSAYQEYAGDLLHYVSRSIDGDDLEECIRTGKKSKKYGELQHVMNELKETHNLEFIYIVKPIKVEPPDNMMDVLIAWSTWEEEREGDENADLGNLSGDAYPAEVAELYMSRMDSNPKVTFFRNDTDFGRAYTAICPVLNSSNEPVALLCGDFLIEDIYSVSHSYLITVLILIIVIGGIILLLQNYWLDKRFVAPVHRMEVAAEKFEDKCRRRADADELIMSNPDIHTGDELEALSNALLSMGEDVQAYAKDLSEKNDEIISMKEYVSKMDVLAYKDSLTGAGNKAAYEKAKKRLDRKIKHGTAKFAFVMTDINYLKYINDNYGHDKGNIYIQKLYELLNEEFSESTIFRIGGDEFLIIIDDKNIGKSEEKINTIKEKMNAISKDENIFAWEKISTAIGFTVYNEEIDKDADNVFKRADELMYEDKKRLHASRE